MEITELQQKIQNVVNKEAEYADKHGHSKLSTCNAAGWDRDIFNHRLQIMEALRNRGYNVSASVNFGVMDIVTTPKIQVS
jgi:hypothetical protein